jgi:hypothetical protein
MGCGNSKAGNTEKTLLAKDQEKATAEAEANPVVYAQEEPDVFNIFIDRLGTAIEACNDELQIVDVEGGPIGQWNNRQKTKKVQKGDIVVKVRKAGPRNEVWVDGDSKKMLELLGGRGPFEVSLKRLEPGVLNIFIDRLGTAIEACNDELQIVDVEGGPIGQWNNRQRTKKVQKGDVVLRVRKAGPKKEVWVDGDNTKMLELLGGEGPFEVALKRPEPVIEQVAAGPADPKPEPVVSVEKVEAANTAAPEDVTLSEAPGKVSSGVCGFCL